MAPINKSGQINNAKKPAAQIHDACKPGMAVRNRLQTAQRENFSCLNQGKQIVGIARLDRKP